MVRLAHSVDPRSRIVEYSGGETSTLCRPQVSALPCVLCTKCLDSILIPHPKEVCVLKNRGPPFGPIVLRFNFARTLLPRQNIMHPVHIRLVKV